MQLMKHYCGLIMLVLWLFLHQSILILRATVPSQDMANLLTRGALGLYCMCLFLLPVPFRETPSYTNRRRVMPGPLPSPRSLLRSASDNNLNGDHDHIHGQTPQEIRGRQGHSPVPSLRSLPALGRQQQSSLGEVR